MSSFAQTSTISTDATVRVKVKVEALDPDTDLYVIADPADIRLIFTSPVAGEITPPYSLSDGTVVRQSLGIFVAYLTPDVASNWKLRVETDGAADGVVSGQFHVSRDYS